MPSAQHIPVLLREVIDIFQPRSNEAALDLTLGLGGHAAAILEATKPKGTLLGLDADEKNLSVARGQLEPYGERAEGRQMNFRDANTLVPRTFDLILADLGLSSPHIDDRERGFSFHGDGPLDMRFDQRIGMSAGEFLNDASQEELTYAFQEYGELPKTHTFVRAVVAARPLHGIADLRLCVEKIYGYRAPSTMPQVFQAVRVMVNDELGALSRMLNAIPTLLNPGGRFGVISYHSLEDRMVKNRFRSWATAPIDELTGAQISAAPFAMLTKKPIVPSEAEIAHNPRARSAKLRVVKRSVDAGRVEA